jgi:flagellar capping protein FliD
MVDADTSTISIPVSVAQGGTGATTASAARTNLGATAIGDAVFTAASTSAAQIALGLDPIEGGTY